MTGVQKQLLQQEAEIASAAASTQHARAELAEAEENRADLTIKAPFSGTVMTRAAEPGEVVQAGTAIITLLDLSKVYLRGFVPEGQIGKVAIGQPAHIFLDSNPKQPVDAYVLRIDPQATFTPENTYFKDDRVKQVVGVKLQLTQAIGFAKPGMPADGEILVQGDVVAKGGSTEMSGAGSDVATLDRAHGLGPSSRPSASPICGSATARSKPCAELSFQVAQGEIFGLIGPDGAGKTSTFQILAGVMEATSGVAEVFGRQARESRARPVTSRRHSVSIPISP